MWTTSLELWMKYDQLLMACISTLITSIMFIWTFIDYLYIIICSLKTYSYIWPSVVHFLWTVIHWWSSNKHFFFDDLHMDIIINDLRMDHYSSWLSYGQSLVKIDWWPYCGHYSLVYKWTFIKTSMWTLFIQYMWT